MGAAARGSGVFGWKYGGKATAVPSERRRLPVPRLGGDGHEVRPSRKESDGVCAIVICPPGAEGTDLATPVHGSPAQDLYEGVLNRVAAAINHLARNHRGLMHAEDEVFRVFVRTGDDGDPCRREGSRLAEILLEVSTPLCCQRPLVRGQVGEGEAAVRAGGGVSHASVLGGGRDAYLHTIQRRPGRRIDNHPGNAEGLRRDRESGGQCRQREQRDSWRHLRKRGQIQLVFSVGGHL